MIAVSALNDMSFVLHRDLYQPLEINLTYSIIGAGLLTRHGEQISFEFSFKSTTAKLALIVQGNNSKKKHWAFTLLSFHRSEFFMHA